jgi:hypothetical protein
MNSETSQRNPFTSRQIRDNPIINSTAYNRDNKGKLFVTLFAFLPAGRQACTVTTSRLKYQDSARMLRRVTQPPFIAGSLALIKKFLQ